MRNEFGLIHQSTQKRRQTERRGTDMNEIADELIRLIMEGDRADGLWVRRLRL